MATVFYFAVNKHPLKTIWGRQATENGNHLLENCEEVIPVE